MARSRARMGRAASTIRRSSCSQSAEVAMADLGESWTTQQLVEFLSLVSSFPDEHSAIVGAVERAAEALEAEVGAIVSDGRLLASTGFSADNVQIELLSAVADGTVTTIDVPGAGA